MRRIAGNCVENQPHGAMGYHHNNKGLMDAKLDVEKPEVLVYERLADGTYRLNGVEFIVPISAWTREDAPTIMGQKLNKAPSLGSRYLHVWNWEQSPNGLFSDWNPRVKCSWRHSEGVTPSTMSKRADKAPTRSPGIGTKSTITDSRARASVIPRSTPSFAFFGIALDVALRHEQVAIAALDLEVDVRRASRIGHRLDRPEAVLAGGVRLEPPEAPGRANHSRVRYCRCAGGDTRRGCPPARSPR